MCVCVCVCVISLPLFSISRSISECCRNRLLHQRELERLTIYPAYTLSDVKGRKSSRIVLHPTLPHPYPLSIEYRQVKSTRFVRFAAATLSALPCDGKAHTMNA